MQTKGRGAVNAPAFLTTITHQAGDMAEKRTRRDFSAEEARRLLHYDPNTGRLKWKIRTHGYGGLILPGDEAGTIRDGYRCIVLFGLQYRAHHLAFLLMTGDWPPRGVDIDHINRDRSDNRWANLRLASRSENNINADRRKNCGSSRNGVSRTWTGKWRARIQVVKRLILLGEAFPDEASAVAARRDAERRYFGEFAPP